ncbi:MAG: hypothetical protein K2J48_00485 [Muribaculaceae bacterium]|nr:hypothetical protein [Muribaculaceae bacterium]
MRKVLAILAAVCILCRTYGNQALATEKIPFSVEETLTERICNGLIEVKLIEDKVLPSKLAKDFLNEI